MRLDSHSRDLWDSVPAAEFPADVAKQQRAPFRFTSSLRLTLILSLRESEHLFLKDKLGGGMDVKKGKSNLFKIESFLPPNLCGEENHKCPG